MIVVVARQSVTVLAPRDRWEYDVGERLDDFRLVAERRSGRAGRALFGEIDIRYRRPIEEALSHYLVSKRPKLVDLVGACGLEDRLDFMPTDDLEIPPSYAAAEHPAQLDV